MKNARELALGLRKQCWWVLEWAASQSLFAALACAAISFCFIRVLTSSFGSRTTGEPLSWIDGTSSWPSLTISLFAGLLALHFIFASHVKLKGNAIQLSKEFSLRPRPEEDDFLGWRAMPRKFGRPDVERLWRRYLYKSRPHWRLIRAGIMTALYMTGFFLAMRAFTSASLGVPPSFRGEEGEDWFFRLRLFGISLGLLLTFFVFDAILLHQGFLKMLSGKTSYWPNSTFEKYHYQISMDPQYRMEDEKNVSDYWDLLLIAKRTAAINQIIYYPFIGIFLIFLSNLDWFDNVQPNLPVIVGLTTHCLLAAFAAYQLPKAANNYRDKVLEKMRMRRRQMLMRTGREPESADKLIEEVIGLHQGAFAGIWEQPAIRGFLVPSGGLGLLSLVQYLR